LPKAKCFAERISSGTQQRKSLPSVRPSGTRQRNALGKAAFAECRALGKGVPSAKFSFAKGQELGKFWPSAKVAGVTTATCR
jgi:hypothetical protein